MSAPITAQPFIMIHAPRLRHWAVALALFLAVIGLLRWELWPRLATHYLGGSSRDAGLYIWLTQSNMRDFLWNGRWFDTTSFYPYGETLAWSDNFLLPSLAVAALAWCGIGFIASYNIVLLGAMLFNGLATWLLCFALRGQTLASLFGGLAFMTLSFTTGHLGHPQLQFVGWIPFGTWACIRALQIPSWSRAALVGVSVSCAFLCAVYYAIFLALLVALLGVFIIVMRPQAFSYRKVAVLAGGLMTGILPLAPFILPYLETSAAFGGRFLHEHYFFSATALSYLSRSPFNFLYGGSAAFSHPEAHLFPGIIVSLLAAAALIRLAGTRTLRFGLSLLLAALLLTALASEVGFLHPTLSRPAINYLCASLSWLTLGLLVWNLVLLARLEERLGAVFITHRDWLAVFLALALLYWLLSLGPLGYPEGGITALGVHVLFYETFPGFSALRAIGRIGVLANFCLIVAATLAFAHLELRRKIPRLVGALLCAAVTVENYHSKYPVEEPRARPAIISELDALDRDFGALVVLPFVKEILPDGGVKSWGEFAERNVDYMLWTFDSDRPIVNGYSGQRSKLMKELPGQLADFPSERSIAALSRIAGLKYIVFLGSRHTLEMRKSARARLAQFSESLHLVHENEEGDSIIEFVHKPMIVAHDFYLLLPNYVNAPLTLTLKSAPLPGNESISIRVSRVVGDRREQLLTLPLRADGTWQSFPFSLPPPHNRVPPSKLVFSCDRDGAEIFMQPIVYERTGN